MRRPAFLIEAVRGEEEDEIWQIEINVTPVVANSPRAARPNGKLRSE